MSNTGGIGGSSSSGEAPEIKELKSMEQGPKGQSIENALHTKVSTLGELKAMLVKNLGEKNGTKMYNEFIQSFAMLMLEQIQQSAEQAKKASQQMRMGNP